MPKTLMRLGAVLAGAAISFALAGPAAAGPASRTDVGIGPQLATAYGTASWGVQYVNNSYPHTYARFGVYNWVTGLFYPSNDWMAVV